MNTQMIICMVIFAATLVSYMLNKIPMWLTAMISLAALYFTGCIDASGALAGFSNVNTLLMATMFVVAAGFRRTSLVDGMCDAIMKVTRGSFRTAYFGYILLAVLLTNFIASPMVVYAIVSPLLAALCDNTGHSRSQYMCSRSWWSAWPAAAFCPWPLPSSRRVSSRALWRLTALRACPCVPLISPSVPGLS